jgi:hypothetical protein
VSLGKISKRRSREIGGETPERRVKFKNELSDVLGKRTA